MAEQQPPADHLAKLQTRKITPPEHQTYSLHFALCGFVLVIVSLWAIWDETYSRRPWKFEQQDFIKAARPVVQQRLEKAKVALDEFKVSKAGYEYAQARDLKETRFPKGDKDFDEALDHARKTWPEELKGAATPAAVLDKIREMEADLVRTIAAKRKAFNVMRGDYSARVWQYEVDPKDSSSAQYIAAHKDQIDKTNDEILAMGKQLTALQAADAALDRPRAQAEARVKEFEKDVDASQRALNALDSESVGVRQVFNPDLGSNGSVDRCESCHMGASRQGLENLKEPFRSHNQDWFKSHPKEKFGCVSCHAGDGIATMSVAEAHGEDEFWLTPMLPGKMMQAACYKCHETEVRLKGAETLMTGKRLFREVGCIGCHKIRGIGDEDVELADVRSTIANLEEEQRRQAATPKDKVDAAQVAKVQNDLEAKRLREQELIREVKQVGPDLTGTKGKLFPGFIEKWLVNPRAFRPTTRMPRFWPEPLTKDPQEIEEAKKQQLEEIRSIVAYLWENSEDKAADVQGPTADAAAVQRGHDIVASVGCKGCHNVDEQDAKLLGAKRFGPELSRVGEKIRANWLAKWVRNPKSIMPHSKMPNLRLDEKQAADVAAYLSTLVSKDPYPKDMPDYLKDDDTRKKLAEHGFELIKHYGCFGCHTIKGMEKQGKIGVELTVEGSKMVEEFDYGLQEHALKNPFGGAVWERWFKKHVSADALKELNEEDPRKAIEPHTRPGEWQEWLRSNVDKTTLEVVGQLFRTNHEGEVPLTRQGYIATKLADPRIFDTGKIKKQLDKLKMPDFGLSAEEIFAITTFILGNTASVDEMRPPWKDKPQWPRSAVIDGQKIIERNNCEGCHRFEKSMTPKMRELAHAMVHGFKDGQPVKDQDPAWEQELNTRKVVDRMSFLKPDLTVKSGDPLYEKQVWAVAERAILEGEIYPMFRRVQDDRNKAKAAAPKPPKAKEDEDEDGPEELADYDQLMGFNPPPLFYQGERARPDWLFGFLKAPEPLREWLTVRMPTFDLSDGDTRKLVAYFAAHDNVDYPFATPQTHMPDAATLKKAEAVLKNCLACHGPLPANFTAEQAAKSAPKFELSHRRLRVDWMAKWIFDPASYLPSTRMPQMFAPNHAENLFQDFGGGDAKAQAAAMAAFLTTYKAGEGGGASLSSGPEPAAAPSAAPGSAPAPAATPAPGASPAAPAPAGAPAASPAAAEKPEVPSDPDKSTLKGVAKLDGAAPKMKKIKMDAEASCKAVHDAEGVEPREEMVVANADGTLQNVVVYVKSGPGIDGKTFPVPSEPVVLDQRGCQYHPHVWSMMVGQTLSILNSDTGVLHNIHAFSEKTNGFNKGMPGAPGLKMEEHFSAVETPVKIKCDVHGWMQGWAMVLPHPFSSTTAGKGSFYIRNLPPGDYVVEAWHEKYGTVDQNVSVKAGEVKELPPFVFKAE